jgi:hypothetical protein
VCSVVGFPQVRSTDDVSVTPIAVFRFAQVETATNSDSHNRISKARWTPPPQLEQENANHAGTG